MTVSSGSLLRAMRVPSRSENSRSHAIQRSRSMCLRVPVHDRCAMLPSPGRLNCAHCGFGHEKRVYLAWTGVVSVIAVLLCAGLDQKILIRRQFFHVTILQDYQGLQLRINRDHRASSFYAWVVGDSRRKSPYHTEVVGPVVRLLGPSAYKAMQGPPVSCSLPACTH